MGMRSYLILSKPGIIMGNAITAFAGFVLASHGHIQWGLLSATLVGLACIIASAGIANNYIDRVADAQMARTQLRALAQSAVSAQRALFIAALLGLGGAFALGYYANGLALGAALLGFVIYVFVYSFVKYRTPHATLVGAVAGAMPPLVGYCAAGNRLDLPALLLFAIVLLWQMPHFFAIAIYRLDDYKAASIPVLPVVRGIHATKIQMAVYTAAFAIAAPLQNTNPTYLTITALLGLSWLGLALRGFWAPNSQQWARQMFFASLIAILLLSCTMSLTH